LEISGIILKNAIKGRGYTQQEASDKLGITRQKLSMLLGLEVLGEDVIQNVKEKLKINLLSVESEGAVNELQERVEPFGDDKWIDHKLSFIENLEKLIQFKTQGFITEDEFQRIKNKIIPKD